MPRRAVTSIGKRRSPARIPTEHAEQVAFVKWFRLQFPKTLIFAIPNGGARHIVAAKKLKDEGVVSGIPDLYVPAWGLWIEMKRRKGGVVSEEQAKIRDYLTDECGDDWLLAHGFEHGREMIVYMAPWNRFGAVKLPKDETPKVWSGTSMDKLR